MCIGNHLGNVLTTISDKKIGVSSGGIGSLIDYYEPDMVSAMDYYPFGMPSRVATSSTGRTYRFGFNGKENDNEVKGFGNHQDYGMRGYDDRIGRFLSVDPLTRNYSMLTPYQFASNSPIWGVDLDGEEFLNSNSSRIAIGLQFDSKLKQITKFNTSWRSENVPDAINSAIEEQNTCVNCIGSSAANVKMFELNFRNPFNKSQNDADMSDADVEKNSSVGPSSTGSNVAIIPQNKKQATEQRRTRRFFTEGASPRIGKANGVLAVIDVTSNVVEAFGQQNIESIIATARHQSESSAKQVIILIQNAINNGKLDNYLEQGTLIELEITCYMET